MHAGKARRFLETDRTKAVDEFGFRFVELLNGAGAGHGDFGVAPVDGEKKPPNGRARLDEGPVVVGVVASRGDFAHRHVDARKALLPVGRGAKSLQVVERAVGRVLFDEEDRADRKVGTRGRGRHEGREVAQPPIVETAVKARGREEEVDRLRADRLFKVLDEIGTDREAVLRELGAQVEKGVCEGLALGRRKARLDVADADFGQFSSVRNRSLGRLRTQSGRKEKKDEESLQKTRKRTKRGHGVIRLFFLYAVPQKGSPWQNIARPPRGAQCRRRRRPRPTRGAQRFVGVGRKKSARRSSDSGGVRSDPTTKSTQETAIPTVTTCAPKG